MKLETFVEQTILEITNGVSNAQRSSPVWVAPGLVEGKKVESPQMINFEVAVTVNKEGGGSIDVWSVGKLSGAASSEHINKVSFAVPVYFQAPNSER